MPISRSESGCASPRAREPPRATTSTPSIFPRSPAMCCASSTLITSWSLTLHQGDELPVRRRRGPAKAPGGAAVPKRVRGSERLRDRKDKQPVRRDRCVIRSRSSCSARSLRPANPSSSHLATLQGCSTSRRSARLWIAWVPTALGRLRAAHEVYEWLEELLSNGPEPPSTNRRS